MYDCIKKSSRTIAPEENWPPNPNSNPNPQSNPNPNRGAIFFLGNCPDTIKKFPEERKKERKIIEN